MATPNRPQMPDWYQADRKVSPHVGPTQREMLTRRIKSLRKTLIGISFIGVATFTALASQHTGTTAATTANSGSTTALVQQNSGSTTSTSSNTSSNNATLSSVTTSSSNSSQTTSPFSSSFHTRTSSS